MWKRVNGKRAKGATSIWNGWRKRVRDPVFCGDDIPHHFQRKSFKRWLRFSFQRAFQEALVKGEGYGEENEIMRWWSVFVEKLPNAEGVQIRGWEGLGLILILRISDTEVGSTRKCKRLSLQDCVEEWMRSAKTNEWVDGIEASLGIGTKLGIVGIQGEDQIGSFNWVCGMKHAPADRMSIEALIPFQIQDLALREDDRKLLYLMYLAWKIETHKLLWFDRSFQLSLEIRDSHPSWAENQGLPNL